MGYTKKTSAIPAMTSNTTPSGKSSVSSFSDNYTNYAFRAFDKTTNYWLAQSKSGWVKYEFDLPLVISKYLLQATIIINGAPSQWTFEGSNDDINWTILDTKTGINDWTSGMTKEFDIQNRVKYKFYRLNIATTKDGSERIYLAELDMFEYVFYDKFLIQANNEIISATLSNPNLNLIPKMRSDTAPSGKVIYNAYQGYPHFGWAAFDKSTDTGWLGLPNKGSDQWVGYMFPSPKIIGKYVIYPHPSSANFSPKDFRFEGSNDGENWTVLDRQTGIVGYVAGQGKTFFINNTKKYLYYRVYVENIISGARYIGIGELEMYETYSTIVILDTYTDDTFLKYGLDKDAVFTLDSTFSTKKSYIKEENKMLGAGRVFSQEIDTAKTTVKKLEIE